MNLPGALRGGRMVKGFHWRRQRSMEAMRRLFRFRKYGMRPDEPIVVQKPGMQVPA